jgi:uncharacterized protein YbjT (DUF2867 family)
MKIVVICGTGPVGSRLIRKLGRDGHELLGADGLEGAQVVVDVSNEPVDLDAESRARVGHHVMLSVGGDDRREGLVEAGPVPYTIVRATQLFESICGIADSSTDGDIVRLPPTLIQPVAADDVASALADVALGSPLNDTVELAGPEAFRLDELVRRVLQAARDPRQVTTVADTGGRYLVPGDDARIATTHFEDWISRSS